MGCEGRWRDAATCETIERRTESEIVEPDWNVRER